MWQNLLHSILNRNDYRRRLQRPGRPHVANNPKKFSHNFSDWRMGEESTDTFIRRPIPGSMPYSARYANFFTVIHAGYLPSGLAAVH